MEMESILNVSIRIKNIIIKTYKMISIIENINICTFNSLKIITNILINLMKL